MTSAISQSERKIESFMPESDVRERHEIIVHAPANVVFDAAEQLDLQSIPLVRAIFWLRGKIMGAANRPPRVKTGLVAETKSLGWGELARRPGRELVMGGATQPWKADVVFTSIPPSAFLAYAEPDRVKIVWTLEAVPIEPKLTLFRTETRVLATDQSARRQFLRYWRFAKFGIVTIRWLLLPALRKAAEVNYGK